MELLNLEFLLTCWRRLQLHLLHQHTLRALGNPFLHPFIKILLSRQYYLWAVCEVALFSTRTYGSFDTNAEIPFDMFNRVVKSIASSVSFTSQGCFTRPLRVFFDSITGYINPLLLPPVSSFLLSFSSSSIDNIFLAKDLSTISIYQQLQLSFLFLLCCSTCQCLSCPSAPPPILPLVSPLSLCQRNRMGIATQHFAILHHFALQIIHIIYNPQRLLGFPGRNPQEAARSGCFITM